MRSLLLFTIFACFLALTWSAAVTSPQSQATESASAEALLDVDAGVEEIEGARQARQFYGGVYYGRPYYGGYGYGYGGYRRPYYGGYYGRPYYGGYYGRPYYGGYGGFYG